MTSGYQIRLSQDEMPRKWLNILPTLPTPLSPPLDGATMTPMAPGPLMALFPKECIMQELSADPLIDIPEEVVDLYYVIGRPTPLQRAARFEKFLKVDGKVKIFFKREDGNATGSHKLNTAIAQTYYAREDGMTRLATETGAGQWGSALAVSASMFGLKSCVYMSRGSYEQKPYRRMLMESFGATVFPSPSSNTTFGKKLLECDPSDTGSLGIGISEAVEDAMTHEDTKYVLGSVLNHVLLHQTVMGLEVKKALEKEDIKPDVLVGCVGGGSNFGGFCLPFIKDKIEKKLDVDVVAAEPAACPKMTKGEYRYDYADAAKTTPLIKMHTLGSQFHPPPIHAGGLRYHGNSPIISSLIYNDHLIRPESFKQNAVISIGESFARCEGIVPAPETSHAIASVADNARKLAEKGGGVVVFNLSGHGYFDLLAYDLLHMKKLVDYEMPAEEIKKAMMTCPKVD